jgi:hypothetical protein
MLERATRTVVKIATKVKPAAFVEGLDVFSGQYVSQGHGSGDTDPPRQNRPAGHGFFVSGFGQ